MNIICMNMLYATVHNVEWQMAAGVKSMKLGSYAEEFRRLGLCVLLFDYRGFGASTGSIRKLVDPYEHLKDWRNVLKYVRSGHIEEADSKRISLWGLSFSAGMCLTLASEAEQQRDIECVIALVGVALMIIYFPN